MEDQTQKLQNVSEPYQHTALDTISGDGRSIQLLAYTDCLESTDITFWSADSNWVLRNGSSELNYSQSRSYVADRRAFNLEKAVVGRPHVQIGS